MKKLLILLTLFTVIFSFFNLSYLKAEPNPVLNNFSKMNELRKNAGNNSKFVKNYVPIEDMFGSLAPIAISPYFGLALTSGASIMAEKGIITNNDFLKTNKMFANYYLCGFLILLTLLTSFPNLFKASKSVGLVLNYLEDKAGIIIMLILILLPYLTGETGSGEQLTVTTSQGILVELPYHLALALAACINYLAIQSVRFFFEIAVFISPIPFLDLLLEITKKLTAFILFLIYLYSPWTAFVLNLIILIISLFIFKWAYRIQNYLFYIYLYPQLNKFFANRAKLISDKIVHKIKNEHTNLKIALPVFPLTTFGRIKAQDKSYLIVDGTNIFLYKFSLFKKPVVEKIDQRLGRLNIGYDLTHIKIYNHENNQPKLIIVLSNQYKAFYNDLLLNANLNDEKEIGLKKLALEAKERFNQNSFIRRVRYTLWPRPESL